jgi:hypothetical protein
MRQAAVVTGLGCVSIVLFALSGCHSESSWKEWFPNKVQTLPNSDALDRALRLCSLTEGEQPFHLILDISPPVNAPAMRAQVDVFWLNRITYRTVIRSVGFTQIRIVNGEVVEEHDTGNFYPRWIENFVDAILDPVPKVPELRKVPGVIPIDSLSQACISSSADAIPAAQACFAGPEPKLTSGRDQTRYVSFDNFEPFGNQQIPRTLVNVLPENTLVRARIALLGPLDPSDYKLVKAQEFTLPENRIETTLVPASRAESMLESVTARGRPPLTPTTPGSQTDGPVKVYVRTDLTGKVREAYLDNSGRLSLQDSGADSAVTRALALKFKPLLVDGVPQQMEATISLSPV